MARQKYNYLSDELIAESLQVTNYLEQSRSSRLNVLQLLSLIHIFIGVSAGPSIIEWIFEFVKS